MARTTYQDASTRTTTHSRPSTAGSDNKEIWSALLDNVSSGKKMPEKNLVVLGGTQDTQRDFLDSLSQDPPRGLRPPDRSKARKTPVANRFALGYTYQDVYDSDHDDVLARLSLYTLASPSSAYAPLLARLLTPATIPHTAVVVLLDWAKPWTFVRTLRSWMRLLHTVTSSLPNDCQSALSDNVSAWQHARDSETATSMTGDSHTPLPLGPGEYDEPLGLPLAVICQNALAVETLEKERGYREAHFDYILQFLRTVLLKHGAGLIYTMPSQPGQLQPLVHNLLDIASAIPVTGKEKSERSLKHNVVDRERVLVPPGWDSWGKIRVLREGFDVEGISRAWGVEIQSPEPSDPVQTSAERNPEADAVVGASRDDQRVEQDAAEDHADSTVALYEQQIQDPQPTNTTSPKVDVECSADQTFLAAQSERLEAYRAEDEAAKKQRESARRLGSTATPGANETDGGRAMAEHIGPVQFNMGGIQYDAEDVLRRLKVSIPTPMPACLSKVILKWSAIIGANPGRQERSKPATVSTPDRGRSTRETTPFSPETPSGAGNSNAAGSKADIPTENLEAYFASLMKGGRGGAASAANSPRPSRGSD
ncbi:hypothetical protein MBLNU459_g7798t1 [Dothideomycetes sp. NU459]